MEARALRQHAHETPRLIGQETDWLDRFQTVLHWEAEAIQRVADRSRNVAVARVVKMVAECPGKVVVSGTGKSGLIAQKIVATFNSTGTQATFLHPVEALHGDLGIVDGMDLMLLLSHSGESDEIVALLPHIKKRQVKIIALVGNPRSTLARSADVILDTGVEREACPLNLAPTASTAVALALGDAIAMTVMEMRGFTAELFARNHPGGRLGKRLTLRVGDLMHCGANHPTADPRSPWDNIITLLSQFSLGAVNIVNEQGKLVGLVTDGDVRRAVQAAKHSLASLAELTAEKMMTRHPTTVGPDVLAYDALQIMEKRPSQISVLPVVDPATEQCLGLLRLHDILRSGLS